MCVGRVPTSQNGGWQQQNRRPLTRRSATGLALCLCLVFILAACGPAPTPTAAQPTPVILAVRVSPALRSLEGLFHACAGELPNTGLVLLDWPAQGATQAGLVLQWGDAGTAGKGPAAFTAVLGQEDLVVVVNPKNPLGKISMADLQAIYSGALPHWDQSGQSVDIQPWVYPDGEDAQAIFQAQVLGGSLLAGRVVYTAPDPAAMREAIVANPGAIGFLPKRWADASVKPITIEGLDPARLRQPILARFNSEPKYPDKAWSICLQERLSE